MSGAQFCKRKADKQKEERKQEGLFLKYLCPLARDEGSPMPKDQAEMEVGMTVSQVKEEFEEYNLNIEDESNETREDQNLEERESKNVTCLNLSFSDPDTWAKCDEKSDKFWRNMGWNRFSSSISPKIVSKENSRQFITNIGLLMEKKYTVSGCSIPHQMILPFASAANCLPVVLLAHHLFLKKAQGIGKICLQFFQGTRKTINI